ncbi:MAG TPA: TonB-dependent receptor plug domain-containing protein [Pedobacter sp.]
MKGQLQLFYGRTRCLPLFLLLMCLSINVIAQTRKVEGVVKDAQGALPGVSVKVKNSNLGTITDGKGFYTLSVGNDAVLVYSSVGFVSRELRVQDYKPSSGSIYRMDLTLAEVDNSLDEVVVVGFGTQKKVNLTGAVGIVDAKALENRPVQNVTQSLQGLVPGLNISQNNGSLESTASINIRGTGTIGEGSSASPLILVDGMEGSLNALNPQDVESISVLKDAAASSIYGSRAAFGVILVTTKRGKTGKVQVNYNNSFRQTSPVLMPEMMDSYTFALYFNDASTNGGSSPHFTEEHLQRIKDYQSGKITASIIPNPNNSQYWADGYAAGNDNIDWYKVMYRDNSYSQEHNLSINGGTDKTTYYLSGNFLDQS